jgi:hypothetical protein
VVWKLGILLDCHAGEENRLFHIWQEYTNLRIAHVLLGRQHPVDRLITLVASWDKAVTVWRAFVIRHLTRSTWRWVGDSFVHVVRPR